MPSIELRVIHPGLLTTVQDQGRVGHQHCGVPVGGAMDQTSMRIANELVGNPSSTPVLEITLMGPVIEFQGDFQAAITGADLSPQFDDQPLPMNRTLSLASGQLRFGQAISGCRAYLAVRGQWQVPTWLGSCSPITLGSEHEIASNQLGRGSVIAIETNCPAALTSIEVNRVEPHSELSVKIQPGPEFEAFSRQQIAAFFSRRFTISTHSNRMGYRLASDLDCQSMSLDQELVSSGVFPGCIQLTGSGQPIVLMRDAQTTGGYPRLAVIGEQELDQVAQLKPGDFLRFQI